MPVRMKREYRISGAGRRRLAVAGLLALLGCSPAQFRAGWYDDPKENGLVYGRIVLPEGCPRLVSVYQQFRPMLGFKGLGDPGVYDDGSFVVTDLSPGDNYFVPYFWIGDDQYDLTTTIKSFKLKAGEIRYLGAWKVSGIKRGLILAGTFKLNPLPDTERARILKTFMRDPLVKNGRWSRKIKAELTRLGG